ncbi:hypothetical protein [Paenibacillus sp. YN15]|uniref:hypothetical protein n=1 Tax=Paenibacillus sp. YN15 TaxID=1742774 RepID=UPI0011BF35A6|nr:hypothetical protein [Paenibacillus sp. YN15]
MKKTLSLLLGMILFFSINTQVFAISYVDQFTEYYYTGSVGTARSPFHVGNTDAGADDFSLPTHRINGPNNQPRYLSGSSDVHNGTDLRGDSTYYVYPMFRSIVRSVTAPGTVNNGNVVVEYDIDGNGTWDGYYAKYMHINPTSGLVANTTVLTPTNKIGQIDILRGSGWPPHLHLQDTNSSGSSSIKLFRFFRGVQNWGYGYYMDFLAGDAMVGNSLYISVNSMDDGVNAAPTRVEFYYKIGSSGSWNQGPNMTQTGVGNSSGDYYRYSIDLKTASGASSGQTVYYYLAAIRGNGTISSSYNWGLWPQRYKMPNKTPAQIIADGYTPTVQSYYVP